MAPGCPSHVCVTRERALRVGTCVSVRLGDVLLGELLDRDFLSVGRSRFYLEVPRLLHGDRLQVNAVEHLLDRLLQFQVGGRRGSGYRRGWGGAGSRGSSFWPAPSLPRRLPLSSLLFLLVRASSSSESSSAAAFFRAAFFLAPPSIAFQTS